MSSRKSALLMLFRGIEFSGSWKLSLKNAALLRQYLENPANPFTDPEEIRMLNNALAFAMRAGAKMARKKYILLGIVIGAASAYAFQQKEKKSANTVRSVKNAEKDN